jgi:hypothetical protein
MIENRNELERISPKLLSWVLDFNSLFFLVKLEQIKGYIWHICCCKTIGIERE